MKHGNISNSNAAIIAINVDSVMFNDLDGSAVKFFSRFKSEKSKYFDRTVNQEFMRIVDRVWSLGYAVYLVTLTDWETDIAEVLSKYSIPYSKLLTYDNSSDMGLRYLEIWVRNRFQYYIDNNAKTTYNMGSNAMSLDDFKACLH